MSAGAATAPPAAPAAQGRVYLREFDLYRVIACVGVVAQHSVLWPVPSGSEIGFSLVMVLHATRELFFFLSVLVACYSQFRSPRPVVAMWARRIGMVLVPYLAWTLIYFGYEVASSHGPLPLWPTFVSDLLNGYYQLYFLVVLLQIYVVLPGVVWVVRRTRRYHVAVFALSLLLQLAMMTISHYFFWHTGAPHALRTVDLVLIDPRYVMGTQLYIVAGALAAYHLADIQRLMERHARRVLWAVAAIGAAAEGYYAYGLSIGNTPGHASDLFQPVAVLWFLAACAGVWAIGCRWAQRAATRGPSPWDRAVTWGADASGGTYLAHVLVLQLIFSGLASTGITGRTTWGVASAILFVGTLAGTGLVVSVLMRTPLRWVLTGPVRSAERARLPVYPAAARAAEGMTVASASAMAR